MTEERTLYTTVSNWLIFLSPMEYLCLYAALLSIFAYQYPVPLYETPDSQGYMQYAHYLYLRFHGLNIPPPDSFYYRTPLFPMLLLITDYSPLSLSIDLKALYLLLSIMTLGRLLTAFREWVHPLGTTLSFLACCLSMRVFFFTALTEWLTFCLLFIFIAECIVYCTKHTSAWQLFNIALLSSMLCLTRPVFIFTAVIPMMLAILYHKKLLRAGVAIVCGLLPVLIWINLNFIRYQQFSLTPFEGISLFGVTSLIDNPQVKEDDPEVFKQFIQDVSKEKKCCNDILERSKEDLYEIERHFTWNIWALSYSLKDKYQWTIPQWNALSKSYALRVIAENPGTYILLAATVFYSQIRFIGPLSIALLLLGYCYSKRISKEKRSVFLLLFQLALAIHLMHSALISITNPYIIRLYLLSTSPLLFCMLMIIWSRYLPPEEWEVLPENE